jgi:hypothetical protein
MVEVPCILYEDRARRPVKTVLDGGGRIKEDYGGGEANEDIF